MIDIENLPTRPVGNTITEEGYICSHCGEWEPVFYITASLKESLVRTLKKRTGTSAYRKKAGKLARKAKSLQIRLWQERKDGKSENQNMAPPG